MDGKQEGDRNVGFDYLLTWKSHGEHFHMGHSYNCRERLDIRMNSVEQFLKDKILMSWKEATLDVYSEAKQHGALQEGETFHLTWMFIKINRSITQR